MNHLPDLINFLHYCVQKRFLVILSSGLIKSLLTKFMINLKVKKGGFLLRRFYSKIFRMKLKIPKAIY